MTSYPQTGMARTDWIVSRRSPREQVQARVPVGFFVEQEPDGSGRVEPVGTILLTNKECPWKCLMCDLWKHTLDRSVSPGDIPAQIEHALTSLPKVQVLKLYNAGSFFDPGAIPVEDYSTIVRLLHPFKRVVVESHPNLISSKVLEFAKCLNGKLEVAIGMETVHPKALDALNKRVSLLEMESAFRYLQQAQIRTRAFLLVHPPFVPVNEQRFWLRKSFAAAREWGASVISLIPTRATNGALIELQRQKLFNQPALLELEWAMEFALQDATTVSLADTWDLQKFSTCQSCFGQRLQRLQQMNLCQRFVPPISCSCIHDEREG